ncbi:hypothetical protein OG2516_08848 [Oceanicola granulosus HTCC2516]|uniref:Lipoprotein n=1 Tax=Oceanicola granulosus (strain ATCC BAA-861 / DSM 15982 / KCTC 12143 / HTCC2516) TaxID=314256 RepID=Q2CCT0_OCEGH|nr:hypothetical protein [Oceanicola granulosus]EAR50433.1 hypothetical protein OG2516_08848 [Oceanicola granulosus HTCC2516]
MHLLRPVALALLLAACSTGPDLVPLGTSAGVGRAETLYRTELVGRYSPSPVCAGQEMQVELAPESVYIGETGCNIAATRTTAGGVALELAQCRAEGAPAPSRTVTLARTANGALALDGTSLQPCFD